LEKLFRAAPEELGEDVVKQHLLLGRSTAEPQDVVLPEGHLELAAVLYALHLLLQHPLPPPQPVNHHPSLQLPQHLGGRVARIEAGQLRPQELAILRHPGKDDVSGVEVGLVPLGGSVEVKPPQGAIGGSVNIKQEVVGCSVLDDADDEVVLPGQVGGGLFCEVEVGLGGYLMLCDKTVVDAPEVAA